MGEVTTSSSSTTPSNAEVEPTVTQLLKGLQSTYGSGTSDTTYNSAQSGATSGLNSLYNNGGLTSAQSGALSNEQGLGSQYAALGQAYDPNSAAYQTLRTNALNDAVTAVGSGFNSAGRYGGGSYINDATTAGTEALAGLDYANMQNDINNQYASLQGQQGVNSNTFNMGQTGATNLQNSGSALSNVYDANSSWQSLLNGSQVLGSTASAGGTESSTEVPWWQALLGGASTVAGLFG